MKSNKFSSKDVCSSLDVAWKLKGKSMTIINRYLICPFILPPSANILRVTFDQYLPLALSNPLSQILKNFISVALASGVGIRPRYCAIVNHAIAQVLKSELTLTIGPECILTSGVQFIVTWEPALAGALSKGATAFGWPKSLSKYHIDALDILHASPGSERLEIGLNGVVTIS
jgi:hypothetical protein